MRTATGIPSVASVQDRRDSLSAYAPAHRRAASAPRRQADSGEAAGPDYSGEERRQYCRRARQAAILIELRSGRDRRHSGNDRGGPGHVDESA